MFATGAANAQDAGGRIDNLQISLGEVFAGQKLKVIDPADGVSVTAAAGGNTLEVEPEAGARLQSLQLTRSVAAETDLEVHGWAPTIEAATAAVGNAAHAAATGGFTASTDQAVGVESMVEARTRVAAELSSSGDTAATAVAVGNDQSTRMQGGQGEVRAGQYHYGHGAQARVDAALLHVQGAAALTASAAANQHAFAGSADGASLKLEQASTGLTGATVAAHVQSGQTLAAVAASAANIVSATNEGGPLSVEAVQSQEGYVRGEAYLSSDEFGEAALTATALGNTVSADLYGAELTLDTDQINSGGVEAEAGFFGGNGYDATVSASATGNAVSGTACTECDGVLNAKNSQVNNGDVYAGAHAEISGSARSVRSTAHAVGNSATYIVNRPK